MTDHHVSRPAVHVSGDHPDRPAIHVCMASGTDEDHYWWIAVGAEEEGLPCRKVPAAETDVVMLAHAAAQSSRLGVGVGVTLDQVAVHEAHMPARQPALILEARDDFPHVCRLAGCNAARLVVRMPLRFDENG